MHENPYEPLRVFISSKQAEFAAERAALAGIIKKLPLLAPIIAEDWSPQAQLHERYLGDVKRSPIYVGLFGAIYSAPTELEYRTAREHAHREILIYIKDGVEAEPPLATLLACMRDRHVVTVFRTTTDLADHFELHLWDAVSRMIDAYMKLSTPAPVPRGQGTSPQLRKWERERNKWLGLGLPEPGGVEHARAWAERMQRQMTALR
jgi:hypothetical protein